MDKRYSSCVLSRTLFIAGRGAPSFYNQIQLSFPAETRSHKTMSISVWTASSDSVTTNTYREIKNVYKLQINSAP